MLARQGLAHQGVIQQGGNIMGPSVDQLSWGTAVRFEADHGGCKPTDNTCELTAVVSQEMAVGTAPTVS